MHYRRKGSFGILPTRSKAGTRWSALLLVIFSTLLLSYHLDIYRYIVPAPTFAWGKSAQCSAAHPNSHHRSDRVPIRIQHKFAKGATSPEQQALQTTRQAIVKASFEEYWRRVEHRMKHQDRDPNGSEIIRLDEQVKVLTSTLSTLIIMDMEQKFHEAVSVIFNFQLRQDTPGSLETISQQFEALLSAYDMMGCQDPKLLERAKELGEVLLLAVDNPSRMPDMQRNLDGSVGGTKADFLAQASLADLTSSNLAFVRLSRLTGDMRYQVAVDAIHKTLRLRQTSSKIPGLWPSSPAGTTFTLDSSTLPAYESLLQLPHILPSIADAKSPHLTQSTHALSSMIQHLLFRPVTPHNNSILLATSAHINPQTHTPIRTHTIRPTSCSIASLFAYSSALTSNATHLHYARRLASGCLWASLTAPNTYKIMPEDFTVLACANALPENESEDCAFDGRVWAEQEAPGFERVRDGSVRVRSEVVRSAWWMWRVTGEEEWRESAWGMWEGVERLVEEMGMGMGGEGWQRGGEFLEEHKRVVETLRWFYLLYSEPAMWSLDEWVWSEAGNGFRVVR